MAEHEIAAIDMIAEGSPVLDPDYISDEQYRRAARNEYHREGEIEIDDDAHISRGDADGAYVQAWVWVNKEEARG